MVSAFKLAGYPAPQVPQIERVDDSFFEGKVLIGDSIGEGLRLSRVLPQMNMITKIGQSPQGALRLKSYKHKGEMVTVLDILQDIRPRVVYILLGSNGLDTNPSDRIIAHYGALLDQFITALPDSLIYCISVPPIIESLVKEEYPHMSNGRIKLFNEKLEQLAQERNCYFINVHEALVDATGNLQKAFAAGDGMHFSAAGARAFGDYLYTHALPEEGAK